MLFLRHSRQARGETMKRRILPLNTLDQAATPIAAALSLWRAARPRNGRLPARSSFDLGELAGLLDDSGWISVRAERPARFEFRVVAPERSHRLADLQAISRHGLALRDAARPLYDDYSTAAFTGVPLLHHLLPVDSADGSAVERLILPFSDDGVGVDELLVCTRSSRPPSLH